MIQHSGNALGVQGPEEAARLVIERLHELKVIPVEVAA